MKYKSKLSKQYFSRKYKYEKLIWKNEFTLNITIK